MSPKGFTSVIHMGGSPSPRTLIHMVPKNRNRSLSFHVPFHLVTHTPPWFNDLVGVTLSAISAGIPRTVLASLNGIGFIVLVG